jgi:hypothetical protein
VAPATPARSRARAILWGLVALGALVNLRAVDAPALLTGALN